MLRLGIAPRADECYIIGRPNKGAEIFLVFQQNIKKCHDKYKESYKTIKL